MSQAHLLDEKEGAVGYFYEGSDTLKAEGAPVARIMVVEDETDLRELYSIALTKAGFETVQAASGAEALEIMHEEPADVVLADVMMPGIDGFMLTDMLRAKSQELPIMLVTARGDLSSKQRGFSRNVDDYMVKPVDLDEMVWRVQALLRRARIAAADRLTLGGTTLDRGTLTLADARGEQVLPVKEFSIIWTLAQNPGRIFTRRQIMGEVWGSESDVGDHTLDVHMSRLRERLKGSADMEIATIRGLGYKVVQL